VSKQAADEIRTRDTTIAALREEINSMKQNHQQAQADHASAQEEWHQDEIQTKSSLSHLDGMQETYQELAKQKKSLDTTIKVKMDLEEASQVYQERVHRVEDERDCLEAALHKLSRRSAQHR
jgi:prefoldin subunit 5